MSSEQDNNDNQSHVDEVDATETPVTDDDKPAEHGGPKGLEPTRYGDWEKNGRCIDF